LQLQSNYFSYDDDIRLNELSTVHAVWKLPQRMSIIVVEQTLKAKTGKNKGSRDYGLIKLLIAMVD
jgi:hypothetical protein